MDDRSTTSDAVGPRRAWYRLHLSTYAVLVLPVAGLIVIVVPGYPQWIGGSGYSLIEHQHGWPFVHLECLTVEVGSSFGEDPARMAKYAAEAYAQADKWGRRLYATEQRQGLFKRAITVQYVDNTPDSRGIGGRLWLEPSSWRHDADRAIFYKTALLLNIATCLLICAVVAGLHEWWRRQRKRFWQYQLRDIFVFTALIAAGLGWWQIVRTEKIHETQIMNGLQQNACWATRVCRAPVWLGRLAGPANLRLWLRVETILGPTETASSIGTFDFDIIVSEANHRLREPMNDLKHLRKINLYGANDALLHALRDMERLESLNLASTSSSSSVSDEGWKSIGSLSGLKRLSISSWGEPNPNCSVLLHHENLKRLKGISFHQVTIPESQFVHLADLPRLEHLSFYGTNITDYGIVHLKKLGSLRTLSLLGGSVTHARAEELRLALPNTIIYYHR